MFAHCIRAQWIEPGMDTPQSIQPTPQRPPPQKMHSHRCQTITHKERVVLLDGRRHLYFSIRYNFLIKIYYIRSDRAQREHDFCVYVCVCDGLHN